MTRSRAGSQRKQGASRHQQHHVAPFNVRQWGAASEDTRSWSSASEQADENIEDFLLSLPLGSGRNVPAVEQQIRDRMLADAEDRRRLQDRVQQWCAPRDCCSKVQCKHACFVQTTITPRLRTMHTNVIASTHLHLYEQMRGIVQHASSRGPAASAARS